MADFIKAFNAGMSIAEKAEENRKEISAVFDELNSQLSEVTQGKIELRRQEYSKMKNPLDIFGEKIKYWVIEAINTEVPNKRELAQWKQDRAGFPCKIILDGNEIYCDDKPALEDGLAVLLADALVAENIKKLMNLKPEINE